jgi:hypothetical protein
VIGKISRGWRVGGLIRYLMGPGRFNEHRDQRIVATWDHAPELHQPSVLGAAGGFDCTELAAELSDPQVAAGIPQHEPAAGRTGKTPRGPVWHCSLRNHAEDRVLSDAEWAGIAREVMDRTGIARHDDVGACRWLVVRHADDHVHIAAVLVRQDTGRRVFPKSDYRHVRDVCRETEQRLGLAVTGDADRTAPRRPSRPEREKAARQNESVSSRERLQRLARLAAVRSQDPKGFLDDLVSQGVLTRAHHNAVGEPDGYSLAVPGDVDARGRPVWYSGGALGRDLSMPRLLVRWASAPSPEPQIPPEDSERSRAGRKERSDALAEATASAERASARLARGEVRDADGVAHAALDLMTALADIAAGPYPELSAVADGYDRAARVPGAVVPREFGETSRALRIAAWRLSALGVLRGRGRDMVAVNQLVIALASLVAEVAAYQATCRRLAQANAADRSADRLRASAPPRSPETVLSASPDSASSPRVGMGPVHQSAKPPATSPGRGR